MSGSEHILVLGLGRSGQAAAVLARTEGHFVTAVDELADEPVRARARMLETLGIRVRLGAIALPDEMFHEAVVSPGVPARSPWLRELERRGVPCVSELEYGWQRRGRARTLAVTGSNGKSTCVKWLAEIFREAGWKVAPAGNYGPPVCDVVRQSPDLDLLILEVSSFQFETVRAFRPDIGVLLNCHPNHLDRHADLSEYLGLKCRMFAGQEPGDAAITPVGLRAEAQSRSGGRGRWITFGDSASADYQYRPGAIVRQGVEKVSLRNTLFDNPTLGLNAAAVVAAVEAAGLDASRVGPSARHFKPLPHRMQKVGETDGITFINDSKATNLAALAAAVLAMPGPVLLIAGGLAKQSDFGSVAGALAGRVRGAFLIGQAGPEMQKAWRGAVPSRFCGTLDQAWMAAWSEARPGDTILLSPGCASFDQFAHFEERGNCFIELVRSHLQEAQLPAEPDSKPLCPNRAKGERR
jgi:UDP-N-acetylmuramoylalanine--D-glutamate ligase